MAIKFSDRVFGANVSSDIIKEFKELAGGGLKTVTEKHPAGNILESVEPTFKKYLGDRTTFARMWTALLVERDNSKEVFYHVINDNRDNSYEPNKSINIQDGSNFFPELTKNPHLKPKAGITSISMKLEGSLGAIKNTTVEFIVHNKNDFEEIFLPFFLKPGSTVIIDYGWSDKSINLYDIKKRVTNTDVELSEFKKYIYGEKDTDGKTITNGFINDNLGLVDTIIGRVVNYNASVNAQGSFECSVELKSENASLLDATITEENHLKYIFSNKVEDILVQMITGDKVSKAISAKYTVMDEASKKEALNKFYDSLDITSDLNKEEELSTSLIPKKSLKAGLFYQNITDVKNADNTDREILYINYGLFEDLFLNELIAQNSENDRYSSNFNTRETFVRYDDNLINRQRSVLGGNEQLPLFLYPSSWQDTRNGKTPIEEYRSHRQFNVDGKQYENEYKVPIIPFRELFISVVLISKTFSSKQNVNEALGSIIESINKDSYGVFKLKMISLNDSFSSISLQDVNLVPPPPEKSEEMLIFDITSEQSIVSNLNYNFETPKGGLASMIAIGGKSDYHFFDDPFKDSLNYLRLFTENSKTGKGDVFYKSLPLEKKKSEIEKEKENKLRIYDFSSPAAKRIAQSVAHNFPDVTGNYSAAVNEVRLKKIQIEATADTAEARIGGLVVDFDVIGNVQELFGVNQNVPKPTGGGADTKPERKSVKANTLRDYYGKQANLTTVLGSEETSVSPVLPISIDLTVYGNTYLNIGDIFMVNFVPAAYLDNVLFQIVGIEHKIDTNWQTTYNTVMKVRPNKKLKVVNPNLSPPVMDIKYTTDVTNEDGNAGQNIITQLGSLPVVWDDQPDGYLIHKISHVLDSVVKEKKKDYNKSDPLGDPRMISIPFGVPTTRADIAMLVAVQETISVFLSLKHLKDLSTYYLIQNEVDMKNSLVFKNFHSSTEDRQLGMVAFVEESYDVTDNAAVDYFDGCKFNEKLTETMVKKMFGNSSLIKNNMYSKIESLLPSGTKDKLEVFTNEDYDDAGWTDAKGSVDKDFGIVVPTYIFKLGEYDDDQGELFSYTIKVTEPSGTLTSGFMSTIRIPAWFIRDNIQVFTSTLQRQYNQAFKNLGEIYDIHAANVKGSEDLQKRVAKSERYNI